jgi:hypothetical protein
MKPMTRAQPLWPAGAVAVAVVALAEGAAAVGITRLAAHSYDVARKPYGELWLHYTRPRPRPASERLVLLITNSQGHVRKDGGIRSYPARLQQLLNEAEPGRPIRVVNWAIPGGNAPEMIVLAARAAAHRPNAVLFVSYAHNFTYRESGLALERTRSDIHHLVYLPEVRRLISPWFLEAFPADSRSAWLATHSRLLQLREVLGSSVTGRRRRSRGEPVAIKPWTGFSTLLLSELQWVLRRGLPSTPILLVSMPVNPERATPESGPTLRAFGARLQDVAGEDPLTTVLDAAALIPPGRFTDETHMDEPGHEQFARWLLPRVRAALGRSR